MYMLHSKLIHIIQSECNTMNYQLLFFSQKMPVTTLLPITPVQCTSANISPIFLTADQVDYEVFLLKQLYGYDAFRVRQLEAIQSISKSNDTLLIIPTGVGKVLSICWQLY